MTQAARDPLRIASAADAIAIADLVNRAYRPETGQAGWTHESGLVSGMRTSPDQVRAALARRVLKPPAKLSTTPAKLLITTACCTALRLTKWSRTSMAVM